jgi:hypothetical protein
MSLELFGLDTTASIILLIGIIWGIGILVAIVVIIVICCVRSRPAREELRPEPPSEPSDRLIPPIFYTEHLCDPLAQEDLLDRSRPLV